MATLLDSIAAMLATLVDRKKNGLPAADLCAELDIHAENLVEIGADTVASDQLSKIAQALQSASVSPSAINTFVQSAQ